MMHLIDFSADIDWFGRDRERYADIAAKLFSKYSDPEDHEYNVALYNEAIQTFPYLKFNAMIYIVMERPRELPLQSCPFVNCNQTWNDDIVIYNPASQRILTINSGTEHLARNHHLLEKGNEYGISAKEFYQNFGKFPGKEPPPLPKLW